MEKDSIEPPEEEEEDSPVVNGNGIAITPGYNFLFSLKMYLKIYIYI